MVSKHLWCLLDWCQINVRFHLGTQGPPIISGHGCAANLHQFLDDVCRSRLCAATQACNCGALDNVATCQGRSLVQYEPFMLQSVLWSFLSCCKAHRTATLHVCNMCATCARFCDAARLTTRRGTRQCGAAQKQHAAAAEQTVGSWTPSAGEERPSPFIKRRSGPSGPSA